MQRRKFGGLIEVKHAPVTGGLRRNVIDLTEVKLAGTAGAFSGYGAYFDNIDSYGDAIESGAFRRSLGEWRSKGKWPKMLLQHGGGFLGGADDLVPIGVWTDMKEDAKGLKVEGQLFALGTDRGTYIYEALKAGALDSLSIGFRTVQSRNGTKPEDPDRVLMDLELVEVSIVTFPANDKAVISSVKNMTLEDFREFEAYLRRDAGFSKADAATVLVGLKKFDAWRCRDDGVESPREEEQSGLSAEERAVLASITALDAKFASTASQDADAILKTLGRMSALARS